MSDPVCHDFGDFLFSLTTCCCFRHNEPGTYNLVILVDCLTFDRSTRTFTGPRISFCALTAKWQSSSMPNPAITAKIH